MRERAIQACRLCGDLFQDLIAGTEVYRTFKLAPFADLMETPAGVGVYRLCTFHLIISLCKWIELYDKYKGVIPKDMREEAKQLRSSIEDRGIRAFRNKVVGHIWDDEAKRPLTNSEVQARVDAVIKPSDEAFLQWINDSDNPNNLRTASSVIERVRDRIRSEYGLTEAEITA